MNGMNYISELVHEFYNSAEEYGVKADEAVFLLVMRGLREMQTYFEDNRDLFEEEHEFESWRMLLCELAEMKEGALGDLQARMDAEMKEAIDATRELLEKLQKGGVE